MCSCDQLRKLVAQVRPVGRMSLEPWLVFFLKNRIRIESARVKGSNKEKRCVFRWFLKMAKDSAARIELGRSFHQEGTFNLKVCESDFVPLWDAQ